MTRNTTLLVKFGIVAFTFIAAVAVYIFAREYPPDVFAPFEALNRKLSSHTVVFGSAPSFLYTLALGLTISICTSTRTSAKLHCILWIALCLILETSQHPVPSAWITTWLPDAIPESSWTLIGPFWERGVFDTIDLIATLVGGLMALTMVMRFPTEEGHAD